MFLSKTNFAETGCLENVTCYTTHIRTKENDTSFVGKHVATGLDTVGRSVESNIWTRGRVEMCQQSRGNGLVRAGGRIIHETCLENSTVEGRAWTTFALEDGSRSLPARRQMRGREGKPKATANVTVSEISCCVHGLEESRGRWSSFGIRARKSSADLLVGLN